MHLFSNDQIAELRISTPQNVKLMKLTQFVLICTCTVFLYEAIHHIIYCLTLQIAKRMNTIASGQSWQPNEYALVALIKRQR